MAEAAPPARRLDFRTWEQVLAEVDRLAATGCTRTGAWDLGQVCVHLALPIEGTIDGVNLPATWLQRHVLGPIIKRVLFRTRHIPRGVKAPEIALPGEQPDQAAAVNRLRAAIDRFRSYNGPLSPHPIFGRLSRDEWEQFHLIHAAHHLSLLLPSPGSDASKGTAGSPAPL